MTTHPHWTGILLAAGRGRRFDPSGTEDKLLQTLPNGLSLVAQSAVNLASVFDDVLVVVRKDNVRLQSVLHTFAATRAVQFSPLICDNADEGMAASLTAALRQRPDSSGWVVALADMPFVQPSTIRQVLQGLEDGADIVAPVYQGRRGHPVGFSRRHAAELLALTGDQGARRLLQTYPVQEIVVDDPGILQDVDQLSDLQGYLQDLPAKNTPILK